MQFRDKEYYQAGVERLHQAEALLLKGDAYALSMYCSGLAVESMLRAFRWKFDKTFQGRHDLNLLLTESQILAVDDRRLHLSGTADEEVRSLQREFQSAMNDLVILWHNNLRFASESRLKAYLSKIKRDRGIRGDPRKKCASDLHRAAQVVVHRGIAIWNSPKKW